MSKNLHKEKLQGIKELFNTGEGDIKRINGWKLMPEKFKWEVRRIHNCEKNETLQQTGEGKYFASWCFQTNTGHFSERYDLAEHKLCFSQTDYWVQYRGNRVKFNGLWYMRDQTRWTNIHPKAKLY